MNRLFKLLDSVVIPGMLVLTWLMLVMISGMHGIPALVTLAAFLMVMFLWFTYKELRVHAAASRLAGTGEPEELRELASREIARRPTRRGRAPFQVYRAIAFAQQGDREAARQALATCELDSLRGAARASWTVLHASTRIGLACDDGDPAAARAVLDDTLRPAARRVGGGAADILVAEAEARVLLAEGHVDRALPVFEKLGKDIRLGQVTRAACRYHAGRCLADRDPDAARAAYADAARLAPQTWMARQG